MRVDPSLRGLLNSKDGDVIFFRVCGFVLGFDGTTRLWRTRVVVVVVVAGVRNSSLFSNFVGVFRLVFVVAVVVVVVAAAAAAAVHSRRVAGARACVRLTRAHYG